MRAIEAAFAYFEDRRHTVDRLSDLADAIDAFSEGAWAVAVALAEAASSKNPRAVGSVRPVEMSRSWEELKHDFQAARNPAGQLTPVVDVDLQIVGWTSAVPNVVGVDLRHPEAERIVGGRIISRRVELVSREDIAKAGGPKGWRGSWACLALCRAELQQALRPLDVPRVASQSEGEAPLLGRTRRWISRWTGPPRSGNGRK